MESFSGREAVSFGALQARLIGFVNNRISNGDFSERGLARMLRVSQPQMHNVLKGMRKLTPELADRVLLCLGMTVLDLLHSSELSRYLAEHEHQASVFPATSQLVFAREEVEQLSFEVETPRKRPGLQSLTRKFDPSKIA